jgi:hypothetical protein
VVRRVLKAAHTDFLPEWFMSAQLTTPDAAVACCIAAGSSAMSRLSPTFITHAMSSAVPDLHAIPQPPVSLLLLLLPPSSVGSDYDFSKQEDREYWKDCCSDAASQNVADSECQKPQW